jgi:hypothetical protein
MGWRWAAFISGCAFLIVCVPLSLQVQRSPESLGFLPDVWNEIEVKEIQITDGITNVLKIGEKYPAWVVIDVKKLKPEDVGVEMVVTENGEDNPVALVERLQFDVEKAEGSILTYRLNLQLMNSGAFGYAIRIYPKHPELPHRQDFHYLKWV